MIRIKQMRIANIDRQIILHIEDITNLMRISCVRFIAKFISSWKNAEATGKGGSFREKEKRGSWRATTGAKWEKLRHKIAFACASRRHAFAMPSQSHHRLQPIFVVAATVCSFKGPVRRALIKFAREKILPDWISIRKDDECPQHRVGWLVASVGLSLCIRAAYITRQEHAYCHSPSFPSPSHLY